MDFSRYEKLRTLVRANFSEQTRALVDEALEYADGKLAGLVRYDGSPLLEHAAAVASIVISEVGLGRNSTISAILHDVVRLAHKQLPAEEFLALSADIRKRFGDQVVGITLGLANISELKLKVAKEQADNFRDLIVSYSEDPRVILIKLADRLEVMRSLEMFPREKWRKKSWESMNLYAQIAHKLGLYSLKSELEDIALKYLEPKHLPRNRHAFAGTQVEHGRVQDKVAAIVAVLLAVGDAVGVKAARGQHQTESHGERSHLHRTDIGSISAAPNMGVAFLRHADAGAVIVIVERGIDADLAAIEKHVHIQTILKLIPLAIAIAADLSVCRDAQMRRFIHSPHAVFRFFHRHDLCVLDHAECGSALHPVHAVGIVGVSQSGNRAVRHVELYIECVFHKLLRLTGIR